MFKYSMMIKQFEYIESNERKRNVIVTVKFVELDTKNNNNHHHRYF